MLKDNVAEFDFLRFLRCDELLSGVIIQKQGKKIIERKEEKKPRNNQPGTHRVYDIFWLKSKYHYSAIARHDLYFILSFYCSDICNFKTLFKLFY